MNIQVKCPCCNEDIVINLDKYCNIVSVEKAEENNIELSEDKLKEFLKINNIELG